ncbi:MAG TPA: hypothetical protein VIB78_01930, partial [Acidimicrobiia bacterium]
MKRYEWVYRALFVLALTVMLLIAGGAVAQASETPIGQLLEAVGGDGGDADAEANSTSGDTGDANATSDTSSTTYSGDTGNGGDGGDATS